MKIKHRNQHIKLLTTVFIVLALLVAIIITLIESSKTIAPKKTDITSKKKPQNKQSISESKFNKTLYSTVNPDSIWVVVNKQHRLDPVTYQPPDLTDIGGQQVSGKVIASLQQLIADAKTQGITLRIISGYRSYSYQSSLYNSYVIKDGRTVADTYSARPGYSEHQTGLAVDIGGAHGCDVEQCFGNTPEGQWLSANAHKYGFIIRYTTAKQSVAGYQAEPWHIRYVGNELIAEMQKQNINTLEEFFDISGGTTYAN